MALKRIHVGITLAQFAQLKKLARKLGLDQSSTVRYCVARTLEQERVTREKAPE